MTHPHDDFADLPSAQPAPPRPMDTRDQRKPPFHEEAEQAVLSAIFLGDTRTLAVVRQALGPDDFYREAHRRIYRAMGDCADAGQTLDVLTVAERLTQAGELGAVGGKDYLAQLIDVVATTANVKHHAGIVRDHARRRRIIEHCSQAITEAFEGRVATATIAQETTTALVTIAVDDAQAVGFKRVDVWPVLESIERRMKGEERVGFPTGIRGLDEQTGGYLPGQLIFFAAVAKGGKSVIAHQIAVHHALEGHGAAIVSAEMETTVVVERMLNNWAGIPARDTRSGRIHGLDVQRLVNTGTRLNKARLWIDDAARPSFADVRSRVIGLKAEHPEVNLVVVDFLQLVRYEMKGRRGDEELTALAYDLKGLAKKLGLILIVPCQLNYKDIEKRPDKRPELQDLQGSSGMVQAADQVVLLYRPSMYFPGHAPTMELIVPAGGTRISPPFTVTAWWRGETMRIANDAFDAAPPTTTQLPLTPETPNAA